jgi:hypothetical protein
MADSFANRNVDSNMASKTISVAFVQVLVGTYLLFGRTFSQQNGLDETSVTANKRPHNLRFTFFSLSLDSTTTNSVQVNMSVLLPRVGHHCFLLPFLLLASTVWAQTHQDIIQNLVQNRGSIERTVTLTELGVEATTWSTDPVIAGWIQTHVAQMKERVETNNVIRQRDPLFVAVFENREFLRTDVTNQTDGVFVVQTGETDCAIDIIQAHAQVVSRFLQYGPNEVRLNHDVPEICLLADSPSTQQPTTMVPGDTTTSEPPMQQPATITPTAVPDATQLPTTMMPTTTPETTSPPSPMVSGSGTTPGPTASPLDTSSVGYRCLVDGNRMLFTQGLVVALGALFA